MPRRYLSLHGVDSEIEPEDELLEVLQHANGWCGRAALVEMFPASLDLLGVLRGFVQRGVVEERGGLAPQWQALYIQGE